MSISHHTREVTHAETAREMDRRGEVIERLESDNAAMAAEITRLRAENAGMRETLEPFAEAGRAISQREPDARIWCPEFHVRDFRRARAALSNSSQAEGQTP